MELGIITPTYNEHFGFVDKMLESAEKYIIDKGNVVFIFTVSRDEIVRFNLMVEKYRKSLNISVLIFENLLENNDIKMSPKELLQEYGKYTFQTLKKFYSMLEGGCERYLVLDSESLWIRNVSMEACAEDFFNSPRLIISDFDEQFAGEIKYGVKTTAEKLLSANVDKWFLEDFVWFYDIGILNDLFYKFGSPMELAQKALKIGRNGIFEVVLYQMYIYLNCDNYGYEIINISNELKKYLEKNDYSLYMHNFYKKFDGECGLFERALNLINRKNLEGIAKMFIKYRINIFRCDCSLEEYAIQKSFIEKVNPVILAASQEHPFFRGGRTLRDMRIDNYTLKLKVLTRTFIHNALYRLSPSYRGSCHVNSTLIRLEGKIDYYESIIVDLLEKRNSSN